MTNVPLTGRDDYTHQARLVVLVAAQAEHDFAGWLASILANVAAKLGSSDALTAGRPGSWEAELVQQLTKGTVGWGDAYLGDYKEPLR
jgi:fructose-1-phosphate kinase PfkB-like protein